jgi:CRISPR/Cas system-associated exonuclease Cas4 (RecB family)
MKTKLIDLFQQALKEPERAKYVPKPRFRPSSMGSPCMRKIYYSYLNVEPDISFPDKVKRICKLGDSIHELISKDLRKVGVLVDYHNKDGSPRKDRFNPSEYDYEFPLKDADLEISAKIDAVMLIDDQIELGEWKSINSRGFKALKAPKTEHLIQLAIYFFLFPIALKNGEYDHIKALKGKELANTARVVYYNKDTSEVKEFVLTKEDLADWFKLALQKRQIIKSCIESKELPPKKEDWCQSCPWKFKCNKEYQA